MLTLERSAARRDLMARALGGTFSVVAFGVVLAAASPAAATTIIFQNGVMDHPLTVDIAGIGQVRDGPIQFDGLYGATAVTDLVAFCVDVYHQMTLGDYTPPLTYTDQIGFTTDSNYTNAQVLSAGQVSQIGRLINYGTLAFYQSPVTTSAQRSARYEELAAVQGAIWQVVSGRDVTSTNAGVDASINNLSGDGYQSFFNSGYGVVRTNFTFLTPTNYPDRSGSQGMGVAGVPEPAAWLLMIGGFGLAGVTLRKRRAAGAQ